MRRRRAPRASAWSLEAAARLYGVGAWGRDSFSVNPAGHVAVGPLAPDGRSIDIKSLVDELVERGIHPPLLLRFGDLLRSRVDAIHEAFHSAIETYEYGGLYRGVYPIKVNQNRLLVEDLVRFGRPWHFGLEAGSKPELLAVIALLDDPEALIVCNGYKDASYVEAALRASRLGPKIVLVAEKPAELELIREVSDRIGVRPVLGIRARLSSRGAGHWEGSGGDRSKFGLGARELLEAVDFLRDAGLLDCLELLHFHLGSQISSIRSVKGALREGGRLYVDLKKLGAPLQYFDAGGGLGVDYDGSQTASVSSMNYTLQEYANDVVTGLQEVCDPEGVAHPHIVTESGRATVAHHAVLVVDVLGVGEFRVGEIPDALPEDTEPVVEHLLETYRDLDAQNLREAYHDALQYRDDVLALFRLGHLSLAHRVLCEDIFWALCRRVRELVRELPYVPPELQSIESALADTYFCNFSLFQSLPDSWAIDQLFPVMPIHRLQEEPRRRGILADITCDSDGKIDRFVRSHLNSPIDLQEVRPVLELHDPDDEPYYLGVFLVGAYQEILGDLHNLFGDTHTVHIGLPEPGEVGGEGGEGDGPAGESAYVIDHVVSGDTVMEVLGQVDYHREELVASVRRFAERAIRARRMSRAEARQLIAVYETGLASLTYLQGPRGSAS